MLHEFVALKRAEPADDLTSALIAARDDEGDGSSLTETELTDTLLLVIAAGYETTINLVDSAVTALLADPGQLELVRSGVVDWAAVVEETLRFASPVSQMPMRYAVEDIPLPDLSLAVPAAELEPLPSILGNGHEALPVRLGVPTR